MSGERRKRVLNGGSEQGRDGDRRPGFQRLLIFLHAAVGVTAPVARGPFLMLLHHLVVFGLLFGALFGGQQRQHVAASLD